MPLYDFNCPLHGLFEVFTRGFTPPVEPPCPVSTDRVVDVSGEVIRGRACCELTRRVMSAPARVNVKRDWNDKANDYRRNPYTQAAAQLTNVDREQQERGARPMKITEEMIQVGARTIAGQQPRRGIERRAVERVQKAAKQKRGEAQ